MAKFEPATSRVQRMSVGQSTAKQATFIWTGRERRKEGSSVGWTKHADRGRGYNAGKPLRTYLSPWQRKKWCVWRANDDRTAAIFFVILLYYMYINHAMQAHGEATVSTEYLVKWAPKLVSALLKESLHRPSGTLYHESSSVAQLLLQPLLWHWYSTVTLISNL